MSVHLRPLSEDELVALYFRRESASTLAKHMQVRVSWLLDAWDQLKTAGKLPSGSRSSTVMSKPESDYDSPAQGAPCRFQTGLPDPYDGRPSVGQHEDPLLERLREFGHAFADDDTTNANRGVEKWLRLK